MRKLQSIAKDIAKIKKDIAKIKKDVDIHSLKMIAMEESLEALSKRHQEEEQRAKDMAALGSK